MGDDLTNRFSYHQPKEGQPEKYQTLRRKALEFAYAIKDLTPESREQVNAIDSIDQAVMWANAAIARNE